MGGQLLVSSLLCLFAIVNASSPHLDPHKAELKDHYEHTLYISGFPCHLPQPRVMSVSKLFPEAVSVGKAFFPDVTVLHHCSDSTGCCTSGHHCGPSHEEIVSLPFKATFLVDIEHHKMGSWIMEYHNLVNHTECVCSDTYKGHLQTLTDQHHRDILNDLHLPAIK